MRRFVGIDLGTTFSAVAYINDRGKASVLPNLDGSLLTPSVVDLSVDPPLVGQEAKQHQEFGDRGVYAFFKREMGNRQALYIFQGREYSPVDMSAFVLRYLKESAEHVLGGAVSDVVITVPAYFNDVQRHETIEAGQKAGFNVLRIINEPTAAALAYGMRPSAKAARVLVYDLGGGTFDVSLVNITEDELRVIATDGDHYLGGKDWDDRIVLYLLSRFEEDFGTEVSEEDVGALLPLAEQAKIRLSSAQSTRVTVQSRGYTGTYEITRKQFEDLTVDLMERSYELVEQVIRDANVKWSGLTGVLLVGGSTRMPMVHRYVERMSGRAPMMGVHPDQAVALGAAIQAAMDIEDQNNAPTTLLLGGRKKSRDVIGKSLGMIATNSEYTKYINSIIIAKNQPIPCEQTRPYRFRLSSRRENKLEVFMTQGETASPRDCIYLGKYVFTDFPEIETREALIDITYAYDKNGIVHVSAVERSTQHPLTLTVEPLPSDVPDRFMLPPEPKKSIEHIHLYMAFDLSGSMSGDPLREARRAAHRFVNECDLTNTSIGIIEFSDRTQTTLKARQNAKAIARGIDDLTIGRTGMGTTTHPFDDIYKHLHTAKGYRFGLILTDGQWFIPEQEVIRAAKRCREAGIEIIAVGFGNADEEFLRKISSSDKLSFFTTLNELVETFSTIAQELTEGGSLSLS